MAWKESQGWQRLDTGLGFALLTRSIGEEGVMAYGAGPNELPGVELGDIDERGNRLEELSLRVAPVLPSECSFIRWDLMTEAWLNERGQSLERQFQELRMNASTRERRLRKAGLENTCVDTMVVGLEGGAEAIFSRMDERTRYSVKLAERRRTRVEEVGESGLGRFHALYSETAKRQGFRLYPGSAYEELFRAARKHGLELRLYLARSGGVDAASAIVAIDGEAAWYLFAASSASARAAAGPSAILYRALVDAAEKGCRQMDLLGVGPEGDKCHPLSGLTLFKSGFGGRRMTRAGTWDYVLQPREYKRYTLRESIA
jgi:lipid II:glycine glycyltransferase (peptidoglycan interpeptide bridge formation enzyme)